jgi:hypothetical protein
MMERTMLTARQFAMLMLADDSIDEFTNNNQLEPVIERQLIAFEQLAARSVDHLKSDDELEAGKLALLH